MAWRLVVGAGVAGCVAYFLLPPAWQGPGLFVAAVLSSAVVAITGARGHRDADALAWWLIAAAVLQFAIGEGLWTLYERVWDVDPFPSWADAFYLAAYPLAAAGIALMMRRRIPEADSDSVIDAAIVTLGGAVLAWVFLISPQLGDPSVTLVEQLVSVAYPLADVLLLGMLVRLAFTRRTGTMAARLLLAGFTLMLGSDVAFTVFELQGTYALGHPIDAGWLLSYTLIAAAAAHPSALLTDGGGVSVALPPARLVLLGAAALMAPVILVVQGLREQQVDEAVLGLTSALVFGLVLMRMARLVRRVAEQAEQLAVLSSVDELTGLANRRRWATELPRALATGSRSGQPVTVAIIDLDHFKRYNDANGHLAGDQLLLRAATSWNAQVRDVDLLARYGGEEFALLLPDCTSEAGAEIVGRLRQATPSSITFSAGVATFRDGEPADALLTRADQALYKAKRAGRDRTVLATAGATAAFASPTTALSR